MTPQQILGLLTLIANQQLTIEQLIQQLNQLSTELQELKGIQVNEDTSEQS